MTAEGSPFARVETTLRHGSLAGARRAARDLPRGVELGQALAILLLIADEDPARYGRAAARWRAKLTPELERVELSDLLELGRLLDPLAGGTNAPTREALAAALSERELPQLARRVLELPTNLRAGQGRD